MSGYHTHRRRVLDPARPARVRRTNLRSCLVHFAPYGFNATYDHLRTSAGIPGHPDSDPSAFARAMKELDDARQIWVAEQVAYAERRTVEKSRGQRTPRREDTWRMGWTGFAHCPDPHRHPAGPLPEVVRRIIDAPLDDSGDLVCRACGGRNRTVAWHDGFTRNHLLCERCGISLRVT